MLSIYSVVLTAIVATFLIAACGSDTATPTVGSTEPGQAGATQETAAPPLWRYVNSGWVSPSNQQSANAFSRELRVDVITSTEELEEFNRTVVSKRTVGTGATLSRAEFPGSVLLVAYLLWLPVQGDPLSVVGLKLDGNRAVVDLELDEDSQGREYPYLFAPMTMVTVDRDEFPVEGPVSFEFRLDGELQVTLTDTLQ
ncbi:uncharacterized protein METZ01_LOCUS131612 [marine metagenome]|uniref:Uncharacterized protein n=1 Tax=marine metagenome TaxID=408172 RepID=A0A381YP02_9ZZZZ|tara:strand:+ start:71 stop:664 length:594 start_codon:yes stop_codon:yes gene_type:complete